MLVVEHPPQARTLRVSRGKKGEDDYHPYRLAFPYILYVLTFYREGFEEMKMFFRNRSLSVPPTPSTTPTCPTSGGTGALRQPAGLSALPPGDAGGVPLAESVPALLEFFWNTGFNQDIARSAFERAQGRTPGSPAWRPGKRPAGQIPFSL